MRNTGKILLLLVYASLFWQLSGCSEESDQEARNQEQRYFDLYVASQYPDLVPQPSGLYFIEQRAGNGKLPDSDDWLVMNYVATRIPQDYIYETNLENVASDNNIYIDGALYGPYKVQNGTIAQGVTEGLMMMKEGAQATMFFKSDLGYGEKGLSTKIPGYQSLKYEVELLEVIGDIETYENARLLWYIDSITGLDTIHDPETDAVLYYKIRELGDGDTIVTNSEVAILYTGSLIDGRVFDENSDEDNPFKFTVGENKVIKGWELAIPKFKGGGQGKLIIPYQLAYGESGETSNSSSGIYRSIPPYENLIFEIKVLDVDGSEEDPKD